MNFSIVRKVNLLSISVILIFGLMLSLYFIRQETHALNFEMNERMMVLLNSLSYSCEYPVLINDKETTANLIKGVLSQKDIVYCKIEDKNKGLIYQEGSLKSGDIKVFDKAIETVKRTKITEALDFAGTDDSKEKEYIGKITLAVSLSSFQEKIADITRTTILLVFFSIIIISLASSFLLTFILSDPINQLVKGTESIAKGDLSHKVIVKTNDEIGVLGKSFNKMMDDLQMVTVSRDYVDNIINSISDILIVVDLDRTIKTINHAVTYILGYKKEELLGKSIDELLSQDAGIFKVSEWGNVLKKGYIVDYEMNYKAKTGELIPVSFSGSVMKDEKGEIKSVVGIARDMREMIKLKKQLFQSEKMAAVGQLAGGVAHEINNPMSVILGFSQALSRRITDENDPLFMPLKSIEREAVRCKKLVVDLLTFSRTSKSESELVDISILINETVSLIDSKCRVKNINLTQHIAGNIPHIRANKNQIQQVIVNLCNNAIDAMEVKGSGLLDVEVKKDSQNPDFIEIIVTDTGCGIPPEIKDKVFDPFFTTKEVGKGTGLGLSISYEIVQKHGGTIDIKSEVNEGTSFIVKLPVNL
jgi:PAS domain S-box-containing protein